MVIVAVATPKPLPGMSSQLSKMTKQAFFKKALPFYVIAVAEGLDSFRLTQQTNRMSYKDLQSQWTVSVDPESEDRAPMLTNRELFASAIFQCSVYDLIEPLVDDFGPDYYVMLDGFQDKLKQVKQREPLYRKYELAGQDWLLDALVAISIGLTRNSLKTKESQLNHLLPRT